MNIFQCKGDILILCIYNKNKCFEYILDFRKPMGHVADCSWLLAPLSYP